MKKLNYAIVGLGIGMAHLDGVISREKECGDVTLCAVCDIDEGRLQKAARKSPGTRLYTDFDTMLEAEKIDVMSICLPSGMHCEFAVKAVGKGINLLVEKPVDITLDSALMLQSAAQKAGVTVGVCHQNRKNAVTLAVLKALEQGRFGKLLYGNFEVLWYRDDDYYIGWHGTWNMDGGGSLINQGIHTLDLMRLFMGEPMIYSSVNRIFSHDIETEDFTSSTLCFPGGQVANLITTTCAYPGISTGVSLFGTRGSVIFDGDALKLWKFRDKDDEAEMMRIYSGGNASASEYIPGLITGHKAMIYDIIDAVKDKCAPCVPLEEGIKSTKLVLDIYASAHNTGEII